MIKKDLLTHKKLTYVKDCEDIRYPGKNRLYSDSETGN